MQLRTARRFTRRCVKAGYTERACLDMVLLRRGPPVIRRMFLESIGARPPGPKKTRVARRRSHCQKREGSGDPH